MRRCEIKLIRHYLQDLSLINSNSEAANQILIPCLKITVPTILVDFSLDVTG